MFFTLQLTMNALHRPTEKWHTYSVTHTLRAVSRKHALSKGLRVVQSWPGVTDREGHPDWRVECEARILPEV